ncbi:MAG: isochorismatase family protein [Patescibacteria group bacterium]
MKYSLIAIDLQNDFTSEGGKNYKTRPSVGFLRETLFPFLKEKNIKISEIVSDYRQPRPGDRGDCCHPGTWGYESIVPEEIVKARWIKCMNSPIWVRENMGDPNKKPGTPYQDTEAFDAWLKKDVGKSNEIKPVLFGLTIDCCVLATLMELSLRGYATSVLKEGVDHYNGTESSKEASLSSTAHNWTEVITWDELKEELES